MCNNGTNEFESNFHVHATQGKKFSILCDLAVCRPGLGFPENNNPCLPKHYKPS